MTRHTSPPGISLIPPTSLTPSLEAGRLTAFSVAQSALMDDDEHGYRGGVEVEAGAAARLASGNCAVGVRTSIGCTTNTMQDPIWSSKTTGNWDCKAAPIDIARHGHHTHKRAVSLGTIDPLWFGGAAGYLDLSSIQTVARNSGASGGRLVHPDAAFFPPAAAEATTSSLPTSPTGFSAKPEPFSGIAGDRHGPRLLSRSVSPPRTAALSAKAAPFEFKPRSPQRSATGQFGTPAPAIQPPRRIPPCQQRADPQAQQPRLQSPCSSEASAPPPRQRTHARTRSDLVPRFPSMDAALPVVLEIPTIQVSEAKESAIVPPSRSLTPQPYRRPSAVVREPIGADWHVDWNRMSGPTGIVPLHKLRQMLAARGRIVSSSSQPRSSDSGINTPALVSSQKYKRYSLESNRSTDSLSSGSDCSEGNSSIERASVPETPPHPRQEAVAFLKERLRRHRSSDSTSTDSSGVLSPTYPISFGRQQQAKDCFSAPAVRVTPASGGQVSPTRADFDHRILQRPRPGLDVSALPSMPVITCTPSTPETTTLVAAAGVVNLNDDTEHVEVGKFEGGQRGERGRAMMLALAKRTAV